MAVAEVQMLGRKPKRPSSTFVLWRAPTSCRSCPHSNLPLPPHHAVCQGGGTMRLPGGATGPTEVIKSVLDTDRTGAKVCFKLQNRLHAHRVEVVGAELCCD